MAHAYDPSTQEMEAGGAEVQVIFGYTVSLGPVLYETCLKKHEYMKHIVLKNLTASQTWCAYL